MLIMWDVMSLASSFTRSMFKIFSEEELYILKRNFINLLLKVIKDGISTGIY